MFTLDGKSWNRSGAGWDRSGKIRLDLATDCLMNISREDSSHPTVRPAFLMTTRLSPNSKHCFTTSFLEEDTGKRCSECGLSLLVLGGAAISDWKREAHSTLSVVALYNCTRISRRMVNCFSCRRRYILCCAFSVQDGADVRPPVQPRGDDHTQKLS